MNLDELITWARSRHQWCQSHGYEHHYGDLLMALEELRRHRERASPTARPSMYLKPPSLSEVHARAVATHGEDPPSTDDVRAAQRELMGAWRHAQIARIRAVLTQPIEQGDLQHAMSILTHIIMDDAELTDD